MENLAAEAANGRKAVRASSRLFINLGGLDNPSQMILLGNVTNPPTVNDFSSW
jgi:hypothetical protein